MRILLNENKTYIKLTILESFIENDKDYEDIIWFSGIIKKTIIKDAFKLQQLLLSMDLIAEYNYLTVENINYYSRLLNEYYWSRSISTLDKVFKYKGKLIDYELDINEFYPNYNIKAYISYN